MLIHNLCIDHQVHFESNSADLQQSTMYLQPPYIAAGEARPGGVTRGVIINREKLREAIAARPDMVRPTGTSRDPQAPTVINIPTYQTDARVDEFLTRIMPETYTHTYHRGIIDHDSLNDSN